MTLSRLRRAATEYVLACEPSESVRQAEFLESVYQSGIDLQRRGWASLDPELDGTFDIVHCNGLLHRVLEPMTLLQTLRGLTAPGGTLLIGSMMLADPERSESLRVDPGPARWGSHCWFIPGRLAFRWMVEMAGFEVEAEFGETEGPRDGFPVVSGYLRAKAPACLKTVATPEAEPLVSPKLQWGTT